MGTGLEGTPRMEEGMSDGEYFKLAAIEVHSYLTNGTCDSHVIRGCINALERLIKTDLEHDPKRPHLMDHVNTALTHIYPHIGVAQVPEIIGLLEEEKELLEKIRDKQILTEEEGPRIYVFCREMGVQLRLLETDQSPHFYTDGDT